MRNAREKQMKKKLALILMFGVALGISGCSSGVSRAEYEKVVQERNEYKAQLDALTGETGLDSEPESDSQNKMSRKNSRLARHGKLKGNSKLL